MTARLMVRGFASWLLMAAALLAGCGDTSDLPATVCTPGTLDCLCHPDLTCDDHAGAPLRCVDRRCVPLECPAGTAECACRSDGTCSAYDPAGPLLCVDDRCVVDICPAGTDGCRCTGELACAAGLVCEARDGVPTCGPRTMCPTGTRGCPCYDDGACEPVGEGDALVCDRGLCVPDTCARGERDCACLPGGRCTDGSVCIGFACVEDTGQTLAPPENPRCYTPCRRPLLDETGAVVRPCDDEGVMDGCVGPTLCVDGQCVPAAGGVPKAGPAACTHDADCPWLQRCIIPAESFEGRCYSDCAADIDCRGDRVCVARVCRQPCSTDGSLTCTAGSHCRANASISQGHCYSDVATGTTLTDVPPGAPVFGMWPAAFESAPPGATAGAATLVVRDADPVTLAIANPGARSVALRIRRLEHTIYDDGAPWQVTADAEALDGPDNPALPWLQLAATGAAGEGCPPPDDGEAPVDPTLVLPAGSTTYLQVCGGDHPDLDRWQGRLAVDAHVGDAFDGAVTLFRRTVDLSFARGPRGRWTGDAWFFSDFDDTLIDSWLNEGRPYGPVPVLNEAGEFAIGADGNLVTAAVPNVLIGRWLALREAGLPLHEFYSALRALRDRSWALPAVASICPDDALCYLADNPLGYGILSDDPDAATVPGAVSRVPFTVDLDGPVRDGDAVQLAGRIVTATALAYPGDPRLTVRFGPAREIGGHTFAPITALDGLIRVGARRAPLENGGCPAGSALDEVPWLVPGFTAGTHPASEGDGLVRAVCLDTQRPYGGEAADENRSLARANPLSDGQVIDRTLTLVDGALIDETVLFAIVRETIVTPLDVTDGEPLSAYGYLLLERDPAAGALGVGVEQPDASPVIDPPAIGPRCDQTLVEVMLGTADAVPDLSQVDLRRLAVGLVTGTVPVDTGSLTEINPALERGHALCLATDTFDGGGVDANGDGDYADAGDRSPVACPPASDVIFFTLPPGADLRAESCHAADPVCTTDAECPHCPPSDACNPDCGEGSSCRAPTCLAQLLAWVDDPDVELRLHPYTRFDDVDGTLVDAGVQGRCAAADGDLAACHTFFVDSAAEPLEPFAGWDVGYVCHATGRFRQPAAAPSDPDARPADPLDDPDYCPRGSDVTFLAWPVAEPPAALQCNGGNGTCYDGEPCARFICGADPRAAQACERNCEPGEPCPDKGACLEQLGDPQFDFARVPETGELHPVGWRCQDTLRGTCDDDRYDLTAGKRFFRLEEAAVEPTPGRSLDGLVEDAFRYETRFRNRAGTALGFTPELCDGASNGQSYCYDAALIADIEQQVDCAVHLYTEHYGELDARARGLLQAFLERTFSMSEERVPGQAVPISRDGFERARAKLLVMLGDEAFTQALSSRFDRAGIRQASFRGQDFEDGGIELQGVAGFEMFSLHLAVQHYTLALERFFHLGRAIHASLDPDVGPGAGAGFVTQGTAVAWFERLLRASLRKADAWAEIADRYRVMARPDLGRRVVERAVANIHLESVLFSRVMQDLVDVSGAAGRPQIERALLRAQTGWSHATRALGATYALLDETPRFLGIPQGFVPFPPLDPGTLDVNAFEKLLDAARRKVAIAADKEAQAIDDSRAFDTSAAEFRRTVTALRTDYEGRLGDICGRFEGEDGVVHPAIPRYAHLHPRARAVGDPCGRMGTGSIAQKLATAEVFRLKLEEARQQQVNLYGTMQGLDDTLQAQCERINELADLVYDDRTRINGLERTRAALDTTIYLAEQTVEILEKTADAADCIPPILGTANSSGNCQLVALASFGLKTVKASTTAYVAGVQVAQAALDVGIGIIEARIEQRTIESECDALRIDTYDEITGLFAEIPILANRLEQQVVQIDRTLGEIQSLYDKAASLQAAYAEAEDLALDVEAARNDPNVRIYRSDAVLAADRTFAAALEEVYEATLVFEYYTGQTWAERERLLFMRLARYGEDNLERYLAELADAFDDFEQVYGNPDLRVMIVSLRDVLAPALLDGDSTPLSAGAQVTAFQAALAEAGRTDPRGRYRVDFRTLFDHVSPLTFGHKVRAIEAELIGAEERLGDPVARIYLTPSGTASVRGLEEDRQLRLPARTAVLDVFFNGQRDSRLDPAVYRSERLRDQPLVNTEWEVVFDDRLEEVNTDVELAGLEDIRFYIYYTDFTEAP